MSAPAASTRLSRVSGRPIRRASSKVVPGYLDLAGLAAYSSLSVRTLRGYLNDPVHPLPSYRPGGKILVRPGDFDAWIEGFRHRAAADVTGIVDEVLRAL